MDRAVASKYGYTGSLAVMVNARRLADAEVAGAEDITPTRT
jgi:hypothetical protein